MHGTAAGRTASPGLVGVLVLVALATATGCAAGPDTRDDAAVVYCLAPDRAARVADGARALDPGLGAGTRPGTLRSPAGGDLTIAEWRGAEPEAFERVCDAVRPPEGPDEVVTGLVAAANVAVGGLLAWMTAAVTARVARRRQVCDALRESTRRLVSGLDSWTALRAGRSEEGPTETDVRDRISTVEAALYRARSLRRTAVAPVSVALDRLARLRSALDDPWPVRGPKDPRRSALLGEVTESQEVIESIAGTLERGGWWPFPVAPSADDPAS